MKGLSRRHDRGQVAGIEAVPFGIAVFVGLTLVIVNGWAQINARGVADSMAREYLRAYTQSTSAAAARAAGDRAVERVVAAHQLGGTKVSVEAPTVFAPCEGPGHGPPRGPRCANPLRGHPGQRRGERRPARPDRRLPDPRG